MNELEARIDAVTLPMTQQVIQKHYPSDSLVFTLIGKSFGDWSGSEEICGEAGFAADNRAGILARSG